TIRVYRNGDIVGTTDAIWNPEGPARDIAMGYGPDSQGYNKFVVDDIKIWNYAKVDFSDRFVETPNFAPVADANGPYTVDEGATIGLDATSSWDPNPADMLTYAWDLNQDGTFGDASGPTPLFSAALLDGPDMRTVAVRVADAGGLFDEDLSTVSIVNVAPTVETGMDLTATSGVPVALSVGYSDPGIADSHTATIDWGDGSPIMAATVTPTGAGSGLAGGDHTYLPVAHYAVTVCVTDDDGDSSCGTQSITVQPLAVTIEIKPGEGATPINVRSKGVIPVTVFTTDEFDAMAVDPATLRFGPDGAQIAHKHGHLQDVNDDGRLDLLVHFATQESGIACGDTEAALYGATHAGQEFAGSAPITTTGCKVKSAEELGSNPLFLPFIQTR
ncbi:MAG: PKD domain-containing protein, partial [Caldilineaceae bacterium]|nr:PKD domain-containing protein [Caldilineaceae bacterium]